MFPLAQQIPADVTGWLTGSAVTVLAFGILAFVRGWIVSGIAYNRALAKQDEQAEEIREHYHTYQEQVIPVLTRTQDLLRRIAERERTG